MINKQLPKYAHLTVATERQGVATLPVAATRTTGGLVEQVALADTARLFAGRGESTQLAVLHRRLAQPVHAGVVADGLVRRVDTDDLVELEGGVLVDPVAVQDTQVGEAATDALLSHRLQIAGRLELVDSLRGGLGGDLTLADLAFATTAADTDAVDDDTLLGLVAETAGLVRARRTGRTVANLQLTVLPAADAEEEAHHIRLLLLVQFFQILVGTHYKTMMVLCLCLYKR